MCRCAQILFPYKYINIFIYFRIILIFVVYLLIFCVYNLVIFVLNDENIYFKNLPDYEKKLLSPLKIVTKLQVFQPDNKDENCGKIINN